MDSMPWMELFCAGIVFGIGVLLVLKGARMWSESREPKHKQDDSMEVLQLAREISEWISGMPACYVDDETWERALVSARAQLHPKPPPSRYAPKAPCRDVKLHATEKDVHIQRRISTSRWL